MQAPPIEEAKADIAAIHDALERGFPPPEQARGCNGKSAISVAAQARRLARTTLISRIAPDGCYERLYKLTVDWSRWKQGGRSAKPNADAPAPGLERRIVALEDENAELKRRLKEAHRDTLDTEAIRQILGGIIAAPVAPPKWLIHIDDNASHAQEVPITIWSDWHGGEVVSRAEVSGINEFNIEVLERRVRRLVERTIDLCQNHGPGAYPGIVVNLLGDMVSGGIHPELAKTDEEETIPSCLRVRDLLVWCFETLLSAFDRVYVPCTAGNHGRSTQKPEFKRYVFKSFDWLIYQLLARHFEGRPEIVFSIPEENEVHYRVFGQRYLAMHGDMLGVKGGDGIIGSLGPIARGEMKVGKQAAAIGRDYDVLLIGHWHQALWLPRVIVNNSLKGYDEYAKNALRASPSTPSQSLWFAHPKWGRTAHRDIFLEDPDLDQTAPWVSVFQ